MNQLFAVSAAILVPLLILFFLPTVIALVRGHHYKWVILALNLCVGITGIGWLVALVWAVWPHRRSLVDPVVGYTTGVGGPPDRRSGHTYDPSYVQKERSLAHDARPQIASAQPINGRYQKDQTGICPTVAEQRNESSGRKLALFGGLAAIVTVSASAAATYYFVPFDDLYAADIDLTTFRASRETNVRAEPHTRGEVVGQIRSGETVTGKVELGPNQIARWVHVRGGRFDGNYISLSNLKRT